MNRWGQWRSSWTLLAAFAVVPFGARLWAWEGDASSSSKSFSAQQIRFFENEVRPILKARCLKCHGDGPKIKGGLRIDNREAVLRGGELGPAVSLSDPKESRLITAIRYEELEMPPSGKLPAGEIDILTQWEIGRAHV